MMRPHTRRHALRRHALRRHALRRHVLCRLLAVAVLLMLCATTAMAKPPTFRGNPDDEFAELKKQFTLYFADAVTGKPIPGATIRFEGQRAKTNAEGRVRLTYPSDLRAGEETRHAFFEAGGYVRAKVPVEFLARSVFFNRFAVTPALPAGKLRIVLEWLDKPRDLDAHMVRSGGGMAGYHISYRDKRKFQDQAWLDRDDMDGYGPETITILKPKPGATYKFYVHDYSNRTRRGSQALADSKARVRVYSSRGLEQSFAVPRGAKGGLWQVFEVRDGVISPVGRVGDR